MPDYLNHVVTETTTSHRIEINRDDLVEFLKSKGYNLDTSADIYVRVPGGGDWSNTDLEIDSSRPVVVRWTDRTCTVD